MKTPALLLSGALLLAACSAEQAAAPGGSGAGAEVPIPAGPAPDFRLAAADGSGEKSLAEAVAAAGGKPLVLVLGSASCSFSKQEVDELAAAKPGYAVLAVVEGTPEEVRKTLPASLPFPVLVDAGGKALALYSVAATPSVVVLDGKGGIAYRGDGGYIAPALVAEMAEKVGRGEAVGEVTVEGG
jgi:hypothetical protein